MRRVKGRDTGPELKVRRLLWGAGFRYRLQRKDLPGRPDIVLAGRRAAIFVHGCFWHGHTCPRGARQPKANADYWISKIARNVDRDARVQAELRQLGWRPVIVWECELKAPEALMTRLIAELDQAALVSSYSRRDSPDSTP
jgi:DNA mismatch endonuclease (patch repair protein)